MPCEIGRVAANDFDNYLADSQLDLHFICLGLDLMIMFEIRFVICRYV